MTVVKRLAQRGNCCLVSLRSPMPCLPPVALRFVTYNVPLDDLCQQYVEAILTLPAMQEWLEAAAAEVEKLPDFER